MDKQQFNDLLKQTGLSKKELAGKLGAAAQTINNWGSTQNIPYWVESWLKNYIEARRYHDAKEIFCDKE